MNSNFRFSIQILAVFLTATFLVGCSKEAKPQKLQQKADLAFRENRLEEARIYYLKILRETPKNPEIFDRIGTIWLKQGSPIQAIPFLLRSLELAPENVDVKRRVAEAYFAIGQMPRAREIALEIIKAAPGDEVASLIAIGSSYQEKELEEVTQILRSFDPEKNVSPHLAAAKIFNQKGEQGEAVKAIEKALEIAPNSIPANVAMADSYLRRGKITEAGQYLKTASTHAEPRSSTKLSYARFLVQTNKLEEAIELVENQVAQANDYIPAWVFLAELRTFKEEYDLALSLLDKVFGRDPANPAALGMKARILTAQKKLPQATAVYEELERVYAKSPLFKYKLAGAYLKDGSDFKAKIALEQSLMLYPEYPEATLTLARLNMTEGKFPGAIRSLENLLKVRPEIVDAQRLLAEAYEKHGQINDALTLYRKQIEVAPLEAGNYFLMARFLRRQGQPQTAKSLLERAAALAPDSLPIVAELVDLDLVEKNPKGALERIDQFKNEKHRPGILYMKARVLGAQGKMEDAEKILLKAIDLQPDFQLALDLLVRAYFAQRELSEAVGRLEDFLVKYPEKAQFRSLLGSIYEEKGDIEKAKKSYREVLKSAPDTILALNNLAYIVQKEGKLAEAEELAAKALQLDPKNGSIADTLGWIQYQLGKYQEALPNLELSVSQVPDNPEILYHVGMVRLQMGQIEPALTALEKAYQTEDDFNGKEVARQQIEYLKDRDARLAKISEGELIEMIAKHPNDIEIRTRLAQRYEGKNDYENAWKTYNAALEVNPKHIDSLKGLTRLYLGPLNDSEKALSYARQARGDGVKNDPEIISLLGRAALAEGKVSWAYGLMVDAVRNSGGSVDTHHSLGIASYRLGNLKEARQWMQLATRDSSESAANFLELTQPEISSKTKELASRLAKENYIPAVMVTAAELEKNDADTKAISLYKSIVEKWPDFPFAKKRLAALYLKDSEKLEEARTLALQARQHLKGDVDLTRMLGIISYKIGEAEQAIRLLETTAKTTALDAEGQAYLGMSYIKGGRKDEGKSLLQKAIASATLDETLAKQANELMQAHL